MGCGASSEAEAPAAAPTADPAKVTSADMDAIRAKMAEKAANGGLEKRGMTFKRKFQGMKGIGKDKSHHKINRAIDQSPEAVAERALIQTRLNPVRAITSRLTRQKSSGSSFSSSIASFSRSITRSFTRRSMGRSPARARLPGPTLACALPCRFSPTTHLSLRRRPEVSPFARAGSGLAQSRDERGEQPREQVQVEEVGGVRGRFTRRVIRPAHARREGSTLKAWRTGVS